MDDNPDLEPLDLPDDPLDESEAVGEVIDLAVHDFEIRAYEASDEDDWPDDEEVEESSLARSAGEKAMSLGLRALQQGTDVGRSVVRRVADSAPGRLASEVASGAMDAIGDDAELDWPEGSQFARDRLGRVIAVVAPVVVESLDPVELMEHIDVNAIMDAVDVNAVLDRVDVNALLDRVDVNTLLERVDVNALLADVDIGELVERADLDAILADVDLDAVLERVDVDAVLARVDVAELAKKAKIGDLVAESTSDVAGSALDLGRRQAVALDTLLAGVVNRILGRHSETMPQGPALLVDPPEGT
ncbi:MAG: hypothetical protein ACR2OI_00300 [Acidimicrobiia bacterium]